MTTRAALLVALLALFACKRPGKEIGPAPEPRHAPAPAPEPQLVVSRVHCTIGGAAPAFFVWFEVDARVPLRKLRGRSLLLGGGDASFGDAVERRLGHGVLHTRTRARSDAGIGAVGVVPEEILAGERVELELFGPLNLSLFGPGAAYPTEDRPFRAELEAEGLAPVTVTGVCVVGPAG